MKRCPSADAPLSKAIHAQGGPNFFMFSSDALYEIHIDNNGDAAEDISFQFRFTNASKATALSRSSAPAPPPACARAGRRSR